MSWNKKDKEKLYNKEYYKKHREKLKENNKKYYEEHREYFLDYRKKYVGKKILRIF